jgi:hypothetical protein
VIRVPKDDLGTQGLEFLLGDGLYGSGSSHRHEYWGRDFAMRSDDLSKARPCAWIGGNKFEVQRVSWLFGVQASTWAARLCRLKAEL